MAAELGVDREEIAESMEAVYAYHPTSFAAAGPGGDGLYRTLAERGGADPRFEAVDDALALSAQIDGLSQRERIILKMRFCDGLTEIQIAECLGISQVHVSRH